MNRLALLGAVGVVLCLAPCLYAEDAVRIQAGEGGWTTVRGGGVASGFAGGSMYGEMIKICGLSDEQQAKIKEIEKSRDEATKAFYADNGEKLKASQATLMEAYKTKDQETIQKAMKDYQAVMAPLGEIQKYAHAQVMGVLTPEQKSTWQQNQVLNNIKAVFYRAKLTDDQLAKIKAACADLAKDKDAKTEDIIRKLSDEVRGMLTDEQKEAMKANPWTTVKPGQPQPGAAAPGAPVDPKAGGAVINVAPGGAAGGTVIVITEGGEEKK